MTDDEKFVKIAKVLMRCHHVFKSAIDKDLSRDEFIKKHQETANQYMQQNNIKNKTDISFSLSADDIINNKISAKVMGCTGRAKLFSKFATTAGLDHFIVTTAVSDDWQSVRQNDIAREPREKLINGHQVIAIELSDGTKQIFDPARTKFIPINTTPAVGATIKFENIDKTFLITGFIRPEIFNQVNRYRKLENLYTSGDINDNHFTIIPLNEQIAKQQNQKQ